VIIKEDPDAVRPWAEDASGMKGGRVDRVYLPADEAEAAGLLADLSAEGEPVTLSGAGTGLTGARIPTGGSVLATDAMGGLRSLSRLPGGGGVAVAGPALSVAELQRGAAAEGLFYAPDPTETAAWLGGTVATNASGSRTFRYASTRRHVRRIRLVTAGGEALDLPRGRHRAAKDRSFTLPLPGGGAIRGRLPGYTMPGTKNACGYHCEPGMDLVDLFIGSEGTLGLVTEIEVALLPSPERVLSGILFFASEEEGWPFLLEARSLSYRSRGFGGPAPSDPEAPGAALPAGGSDRIDARVLETFDGAALEFMRPHHPAIPAAARAAVYFEQETSAATESGHQERWLRLAEEHGALVDDSWFADSEEGGRRFREFRHALPVGINEWLSRHGQRKIAGDMAVPDGAFREMIAAYHDILDPSGLAWLSFGHMGNNHLHVNILPRDDEEAARAREAYGRMVERICALGGTVSAEHGLGKIKAKYLAAMYGEGAFREMAALKRAFDPALILSRGNMIPEEHLAL
jgi:D-lactate dehydrogenase (cytochrome)